MSPSTRPAHWLTPGASSIPSKPELSEDELSQILETSEPLTPSQPISIKPKRRRTLCGPPPPDPDIPDREVISALGAVKKHPKAALKPSGPASGPGAHKKANGIGWAAANAINNAAREQNLQLTTFDPEEQAMIARAMSTPADMAEVISKGEFKKYKHIEYLSSAIVALVNRQISARILICEMPPRHGKSFLCSQFTPVWFLTNNPTKRVILATYEAEFAEYWGRKARDIMMTSPFPIQMSTSKLRADWWETAQGGGMATAGVGGPIVGKGADLLIIDDPIKNQEQAMSATYRQKTWEWLLTTALTRREPGAVVLILMTRWHEADMVGKLIQAAADGGHEVCRIRFPAFCEDEEDVLGRHKGDALCPERFPVSELQSIKDGTQMLPQVWDALYQQRPSAEAGNIIKRDWFRVWTELPVCDEYCMSWDMAFKDLKTSSWVVGQVWGRIGGDMFLLDQVRGHWACPDTLVQFLSLLQKWPQCGTKLVENKANGPAVVAFLGQKISGLTDVNPDMGGSKFARLQAVAWLFKAGNVYVPNPNLYAWVPEYIHELTTFPNAEFDDQCDASSQMLAEWIVYGTSYAASAQAFSDLAAFLPASQIIGSGVALPPGFGTGGGAWGTGSDFTPPVPLALNADWQTAMFGAKTQRQSLQDRYAGQNRGGTQWTL